jgi:VWFA-related protein
MRNVAHVVVAAVLAAAPGSSIVHGGQARSQASDVTAILVDVVVRDRAGEPVTDLGPEDFEVIEDGARQDIGSFTPIFRDTPGETARAARLAASSPAAATAPSAAPSAPASTPVPVEAMPTEVLALVFDRLSPDGRALAHTAAVNYLKAEHPDRLVGVYGIDLSLAVLQPFTREMALVRTAIDVAGQRATSAFAATRAERRDLQDQALRSDTQASAAAGAATGQGAGAAGAAAGAAAVEAQVAQMQQRMLETFETLERDQRGYSTANGLLAVVSGMRNIPGRKAIVFFSEGLSIPPNVQERFLAVVAAANRANVSIYSMDAGGLRTESTLKETRDEVMAASQRALSRNPSRDLTGEPMTAALERNENNLRLDPHSGLGQLSDQTGGLLVANTNDFRRALARVDSDMRNYYMLSYVPSNADFNGQYRNIVVRVNRPGVQVQHRKGYFAVHAPAGEPVLTYEAPALAVLDRSSVPNAFPFRAGALRFPEASRPGLTPIVVQLPTAGLTFKPADDGKNYTSDVTVLVRFRNDSGELLEKHSQRYELQGPIDQMDRATLGEVIFYRQPELPPGLYTMETVVYDSLSGKASVRFSTIEKPHVNPDALRMSSLVVVRRGERVPDDEQMPRSPLFVGDTLLHPNLGEALHHGQDAELPFYFTAYVPRGGGKASAELELLQNARPLARVPLELADPDAEGRVQQVSRIPIGQLKPGTYELRVTVRQASSAVAETALFRLVD